MSKRRIFWKFYVPFVVVMMVIMMVFAITGEKGIKDFYLDEMESELKNSTEKMAEDLLLHATKDGTLDSALCQQFINDHRLPPLQRIVVTDVNGNLLAQSSGRNDVISNFTSYPEIRTALAGKIGISLRYVHSEEEEFFFLTRPIFEKDQTELKGIVRFSYSFASVRLLSKNLMQKIFIAGFWMLAVWSLIAFPLIKRITYPLEKLRSAVVDLQKLDGSKLVHVGPEESEEVRVLSNALNDMVERINKQVKKISDQRSERESIFSSMVEGVITVDLDGKVFHWNKAACELFQVPYGQNYKGKPLIEVFKLDSLEQFNNRISKQGRLREEFYLKNGTICEIQGTSLEHEGEKRMGTLMVVHDVTRIRELEDHRRDFVANVGHELRTPLTAIQGFIETLQDGVDDPAIRKRFLDIVQNHSFRLRQIVEDLFLLSNIENDVPILKSNFTKISVEKLLDTLKELCRDKYEKRNVTIKIVNSINARELYCHKNLLELALSNIVENAIKYGPEGGTVTISTEGLSKPQISDGIGKGQNSISSTEYINFKIQDDGPGIPIEHQERIFERFYSIDKARSRQTGGSGLGLSLVKHIALLHQGQVFVSTNSNQDTRNGAIFNFQIPLNEKSS